MQRRAWRPNGSIPAGNAAMCMTALAATMRRGLSADGRKPSSGSSIEIDRHGLAAASLLFHPQLCNQTRRQRFVGADAFAALAVAFGPAAAGAYAASRGGVDDSGIAPIAHAPPVEDQAKVADDRSDDRRSRARVSLLLETADEAHRRAKDVLSESGRVGRSFGDEKHPMVAHRDRRNPIP
jgi:hypothetical protein